MGTYILSSQEEVEVSPICWKNYANIILGHDGPILRHYQEKWETVNSVRNSTMLETEACNPQSSSRTSAQRSPPSPWHCASTHCCCNRNWYLRAEIIPLTVQISLHLTIIKACEDEDSTVMTKWRRWCISSFNNNQKLFFFYWNTEVCQKMWKVRSKGRWLHGKITSYLDLYMMMCISI